MQLISPNPQHHDKKRHGQGAAQTQGFKVLSIHHCLDFMGLEIFSQSMRMTDKQIQKMVQQVFTDLKAQNVVVFKDKEEKVFQRAIQLIKAEFQKEQALDMEVNRMMDDLERQNPGSFQRYKMFPLLKRRLAKEKGIIL